MKKLKKLNRNNRALLALLVIILAIAITGITSRRSGNTTISVLLPHHNLTVFIDDTRVSHRNDSDEVKTFKVSPGTHTVLLAGGDLWPWAKEITVDKNEKAKLYPFLFSSRVTGIQLSDPEKTTATRTAPSPTELNPRISPSGNTTLWIENDRSTVVIDWINSTVLAPYYICQGDECGGRTFVFTSDKQIDNAFFYPDREDLLIIQTGEQSDTIYVIEADRRGTQNIHPVYEGRNIYSNVEESSLFVLEKDALYQISL